MFIIVRYTRHEIEYLVCGSPIVDVDVLRRHTVCRNGLSMSHPLVKNLFLTLESFSHEERQLFLRFVPPRALTHTHTNTHTDTQHTLVSCPMLMKG